ncbi:MAG: hypothetical protein JSS81_28230 [Acidobacteria bacterium]|nr:hypothetical protein [Acidobacteriota bacterium]
MSEISAENLARLNGHYRSTVLIVAGQILMALILGFVSVTGIVRNENPKTDTDFTSFWVAVLFVAVGSLLLRRLFFNWERLRNIALLRGIAGLLGNLRVNSLILSSMAEIVALMGAVIAYLSGNAVDMIRALAVSLVVFLVNFPRRNVWKKIVSNLEKV